MQSSRFTCGVTEGGRTFEFFDNWTQPDNRHKVLDEPWIGFTVFHENAGGHLEFQKMRDGSDGVAAKIARWSDLEE